jgi:hypothetical protein
MTRVTRSATLAGIITHGVNSTKALERTIQTLPGASAVTSVNGQVGQVIISFDDVGAAAAGAAAAAQAASAPLGAADAALATAQAYTDARRPLVLSNTFSGPFYEAQLSDSFGVIGYLGTDPTSGLIPHSTSVPWRVGTLVRWAQIGGAGQIHITGAPGVSVSVPGGPANAYTARQWAIVRTWMYALDQWVLSE